MINKNEFVSKLKLSLTEVLLIVVGVSIALAADSWLVERSEKIRTNQLLEALEVEWVANQSQTLGMMLRYQQDMVFVRDTLEWNLSLLRERKRK